MWPSRKRTADSRTSAPRRDPSTLRPERFLKQHWGLPLLAQGWEIDFELIRQNASRVRRLGLKDGAEEVRGPGFREPSASARPRATHLSSLAPTLNPSRTACASLVRRAPNPCRSSCRTTSMARESSCFGGSTGARLRDCEVDGLVWTLRKPTGPRPTPSFCALDGQAAGTSSVPRSVPLLNWTLRLPLSKRP